MVTATSTSLAVSWAAPTNTGGSTITGYSVQYRISDTDDRPGNQPGSWEDVTHTGTGTDVTVTGLEPNTSYDVRVAANNTAGAGEYAQASGVTGSATAPGLVQNLSVTVSSKSVLSVTWDAPTDNGGSPVTGYSVQYRLSDTDDNTQGNQPGAWQAVAHEGTGTEASVTGLAAGTKYDVRVAAVSAAGTGGNAEVSGMTQAAGVPGVVRNLAVDAISNSSLSVTWEVPAGSAVTGYAVQFRLVDADGGTDGNQPGAWQDVLHVGSGTSATIRGLTAATGYDVRVAAKSRIGMGNYVQVTATTASTVAPGLVRSLSVRAAGRTQLQVKWAAPLDVGSRAVTSYSVQYRLADTDADREGDQPGPWKDVTHTGTTATVAGLVAGTAYDVRVAAISGADMGAYRLASATTQSAALPSLVQNLHVSVLSGSSLSASWDAPADNGGSAVTSYSVQYRVTDLDGNTAGAQPGTWHKVRHAGVGTRVTVSNLVEQTAYDVQVAAVNVVGSGAYAQAHAMTTSASVPGRVLNLGVSTFSGSSVSVTWEAPAETGGSVLRGYAVQYRLADVDTDGNQSGPWQDVPHTGTTATITGLAAGTTCDVRVAAINSVGVGPYARGTATTASASAPGVVSNLSLSATGRTLLSVTWSAPSDDGGSAVTGYSVQYRNEYGFAYQTGVWHAVPHTGTGTSAAIANLVAGTAYVVRVAAENAVGTGPYVQETAATASASAPGLVQNLSVSAVGQTRLSAIWAAPVETGSDAVTGYSVQYRIADMDPDRRGDQPGAWQDIAHLGTGTAASVTGLLADTSYDVQVAAINGAGTGAYAQEGATTHAATPPGVVGSLNVGAAGWTELDGSWSAPTETGGAPMVGFDVHIRRADTDGSARGNQPGNWRKIEHVGTSTSTRITNLSANVSYDVRVAAVNRAGRGPQVTVTAATLDLNVPQAPVSLHVNPLGPAALAVSWALSAETGGAAIDGFEVGYRQRDVDAHQAGDQPGAWQVARHGRTVMQATIPDLRAGTQYVVRVAAITQAGRGAYAQHAAATAAIVPGAPEAVTVCTATEKALDVFWRAPRTNGGESVKAYVLQYRRADTGGGAGRQPGPWMDAPVAGTGMGERIENLAANTAYDVRVAATNAVGTGAYMVGGAATQAPQNSGAPTELTVCADAPMELAVSWSALRVGNSLNASYALGYRLTGASNWTEVQLPQNVTSTRLRNLASGVAYQVRVGLPGEGVFAQASVTTRQATVAHAPPGLQVTTASTDALEIAWDAPRDGGAALGAYEVGIRQTDTDVDAGGNQPGAWEQERIEGPGTGLTLRGLLPGTAYDLRVAAVNDVGTGAYAQETAFTLAPPEFEADWHALVELYSATDGAHWNQDGNWSSATAEAPRIPALDAWYGVTMQHGRVTKLQLSGNNLQGDLPDGIGDLGHLTDLAIENNRLTGQLPHSMTGMARLSALHFGGQELCAPLADTFQTWLAGISDFSGPNCSSVSLRGMIEEQTYAPGQAVSDLALPKAAGGTPPYTYTLRPALPEGLVFDSGIQVIHGTVSDITDRTLYTYEVTDAHGYSDTLAFSLTVAQAVAREYGNALPATFALKGNYPNPFHLSAQIVLDLPRDATVSVQVFDVLGRRVFEMAPAQMHAGWARKLEIRMPAAASGTYLYRVTARTGRETMMGSGRLTLLK